MNIKTFIIALLFVASLCGQVPAIGPALVSPSLPPAFVTGQAIQATIPGPTGSSATDSFPAPATVGNLVVYGTGLYANDFWTVTDGHTNSWAQNPPTTFFNATDSSMADVMGYSKITATGSPFTISATPHLTTAYSVLAAAEYSGLTGLPDGTFPTPLSGTGTAIVCPSITTHHPNEVVIAVVVAYTPASVAATSGFALRATTSNGSGSISLYLIDQIVPTAGTYVPTMTFGGPTGPYSCVDGAWL